MLQLQSCLGALVIPAIAFAFSEHHRAVSWRRVLPAMALTVVLTVLLLKIPALRAALADANGAVDAIAAATRAGTSFVFGYLAAVPCPSIPNSRAANSSWLFRRCRWCW